MVASCDAVCKENQFACADGKQVLQNKYHICNHDNFSQNKIGIITISYYQCIPIHDVCNGYDRCKDGSDEAPELCKGWDCNKTGAGYFKCGNGLRYEFKAILAYHVDEKT